MAKALIVLAATVAACMAAGPTNPLINDACVEEGSFTVDAENMCWYWQCVLGEDGNLAQLPRPCALGSKISYNYVSGVSNPCTINFDNVIGYVCDRDRPSVDGPPECHPKVCENGGTPVYESNICWCQCTADWMGDHDCSLPTRDPELLDLPPLSNICVDGEPLDNWCADNPCQNGGSCFNQCDTHYCLCPNRDQVDYYGKNCELPPN